MKAFSLALVGNPNVGKSSLINQLTGSQQHVANWPGKTVEFYQGSFEHQDVQFNIVDLPGTYSLNALSAEEVITRDYLLDHQPDLIINVVDASQLERNLYLTVQLLELALPCILVLNKMDLVSDQKIEIDFDKLSERLGIAVVPVVADRGKGISELMQSVTRSLEPAFA